MTAPGRVLALQLLKHAVLVQVNHTKALGERVQKAHAPADLALLNESTGTAHLLLVTARPTALRQRLISTISPPLSQEPAHLLVLPLGQPPLYRPPVSTPVGGDPPEKQLPEAQQPLERPVALADIHRGAGRISEIHLVVRHSTEHVTQRLRHPRTQVLGHGRVRPKATHGELTSRHVVELRPLGAAGVREEHRRRLHQRRLPRVHHHLLHRTPPSPQPLHHPHQTQLRRQLHPLRRSKRSRSRSRRPTSGSSQRRRSSSPTLLLRPSRRCPPLLLSPSSRLPLLPARTSRRLLLLPRSPSRLSRPLPLVLRALRWVIPFTPTPPTQEPNKNPPTKAQSHQLAEVPPASVSDLLAHSGQRGLSPSPHSTTPTAPSPPLASRSPRRPEHTVIRAQNRARALTQVTGTKSLQRQLLAQIQERHSKMHLHLLRALQADPTTTPPIHMRPGKGATALGVPVRGEINAEHRRSPCSPHRVGSTCRGRHESTNPSIFGKDFLSSSFPLRGHQKLPQTRNREPERSPSAAIRSHSRAHQPRRSGAGPSGSQDERPPRDKPQAPPAKEFPRKQQQNF